MDPADLAWEFLRRNPEYRAAYAAHTHAADRRTDGPARRWGLRFPG
jgi:hypothetical protein